jgi:hypothetical protein
MKEANRKSHRMGFIVVWIRRMIPNFRSNMTVSIFRVEQNCLLSGRYMFKLYCTIAVPVRSIQILHSHGVPRSATRWQESPTRMRICMYNVNHHGIYENGHRAVNVNHHGIYENGHRAVNVNHHGIYAKGQRAVILKYNLHLHIIRVCTPTTGTTTKVCYKYTFFM